MAFKRTINAVDTHAGTPMRVVTGGIPNIPGKTVYDKMKWMEANDDGLRKLLLREPRGYPAHCCNIIVPPGHPEADAGYVIMEQI
ncbi:MAG TPA: proline racemase family protein, partial [Shinella sp.]|nr:proline racemase family protein [Shinella sp.]